MTPDKEFRVGGTKFCAVRVSRPKPHWRVRVVESGEVLPPGAGGISNDSVPKMRADIQAVLDGLSRGDIADFRRRFGLPETA